MTQLKFLLISLVLSTQSFAQTRVDIGLFSEQDLSGWKQKKFSFETRYSLQQPGKQVILVADSHQSASAFYRKIRVDLQQTPVLNWSWYKKQPINPGNESKKSGDDYVARIYVIKDGGFLFWKKLAINYVWSNQHTQGESWDNPFAGSNAKMLSQRDAASPDNTWFFEKRNVIEDFAALHGKKIDYIDGVALMTDSDNSGLEAKAYYGDIFFSAE